MTPEKMRERQEAITTYTNDMLKVSMGDFSAKWLLPILSTQAVAQLEIAAQLAELNQHLKSESQEEKA